MKRNQSFVKGKLKIPPAHPSPPSNPTHLYCFFGGGKPQQQKSTPNTQTNLQTSNLNAREDIWLGGWGGSGREPITAEGERRKGISKPQHLRANAPPKNGDRIDTQGSGRGAVGGGFFSKHISQSTAKHFLPTPNA